jgi:hypothetical protein
MAHITRAYKLIISLKKMGMSSVEIRDLLELTPKQYERMLTSDDIVVKGSALLKAHRMLNEMKRLDVETQVLDNANSQAVMVKGNGLQAMGKNTALLREVKSPVLELESEQKDNVINFILKKD